MATLEELDARLRALEGAVTPLATTPANPITIGELTDVPAPQSPINAQFHQEVANRIIHRFPTTTAMNGWAAANGSFAFVAPTHYRRVGGAWVAITDVNSLTPINNNLTTLNSQVAALQKQQPIGMQGAFINVNTSATGDARITFPTPFTAVPSIVATVGGANSTIASVWVVTHSADTTGFSVRAFFGVDHAAWQGLLSLAYIASGTIA